MESSRGRWWLAGLIAGAAGLATSYLVASLMSIRESPVVAVADLVIRLTPGPIAARAIDLLGHADKPVLVIGILVIMGVVFAGARRPAPGARGGRPPSATRCWRRSARVAVLSRNGAHLTDALPVAVGFLTWLVALSVLTEPLRREPGRTTPDAGAPAPRRAAASCSVPRRWRGSRRCWAWSAGSSVAAGARSRRPGDCCGSRRSPSRGSRPRPGSASTA